MHTTLAGHLFHSWDLNAYVAVFGYVDQTLSFVCLCFKEIISLLSFIQRHTSTCLNLQVNSSGFLYISFFTAMIILPHKFTGFFKLWPNRSNYLSQLIRQSCFAFGLLFFSKIKHHLFRYYNPLYNYKSILYFLFKGSRAKGIPEELSGKSEFQFSLNRSQKAQVKIFDIDHLTRYIICFLYCIDF